MASDPSTLALLSSNLTDIHDDIGYFATPLNEVHTLLGNTQKLLGEPKSLNDKLKEVLTVLAALESVCKSAGWVPEVGQGATTAANLLNGVNTFIRDTRSALTDVERGLKPIQTWIGKVQKPVDKGWSAIAMIERDLETVANVAGKLDKQYRGNPPANVEHCAELLNTPVQPLVRPFNDAKDIAGRELNRVEQPLRLVVDQLQRVTDFTGVVDTVYNALAGLRRLITTIASAVKKAADYGKAAIEAAITKAAKALAPKTYQKVKAMLDAVQAEVDKVKKQIANFAFKPVKLLVEKVRDIIKSKLASLPEVKALQDAFSQVIQTVARIGEALADLPDPCAKMLRG
jgi:hypothetical protein